MVEQEIDGWGKINMVKWITKDGKHIPISDSKSANRPTVDYAQVYGEKQKMYIKSLNIGNAKGNGGDKTKMQGTKIGQHTYLLSPEETSRSIELETKDKVKTDLETRIKKLAQSNNETPKQVMQKQRFSTDNSNAIIDNSFNRLMADGRDEYDTLTDDEISVHRTWKRTIRDEIPKIKQKIISNAIKDLEAGFQ